MFYTPEASRGWQVHKVYEGSDSAQVFEQMASDADAPGESDIGIRNLIYTHVINLRPKRVLEIGSHIGNSALVIGSALKKNDYGKLLSLEPSAHYAEKARRYAAQANLSDWVEIIPSYSTDEFTRERLRHEAPFQVVFIDASHEYAHALADIELSAELLADNGVIVLHDVGRASNDMDPTRRGGVRQALHDFCAGHNQFRCIYYEHPLWLNPCGAALLVKELLDPAIPQPHQNPNTAPTRRAGLLRRLMGG